MGRRRFGHLHTELSVAVGVIVSRWALWLRLEELGWPPERLTREAVLAFERDHVDAFLAERRLSLAPRAARRLARTLARFEPARPTPEEVMTRLDTARRAPRSRALPTRPS